MDHGRFFIVDIFIADFLYSFLSVEGSYTCKVVIKLKDISNADHFLLVYIKVELALMILA